MVEGIYSNKEKKMKRYRVLILLMVMVISRPAMAKETAWEASYRLEISGQYAEAAVILETGKTAKSEPELTAIRIAWLHYLQGKYNDAVQHYENAMKIKVPLSFKWVSRGN